MPTTATKKLADASSESPYWSITYSYKDEKGVTQTVTERINLRLLAQYKAIVEGAAGAVVT